MYQQMGEKKRKIYQYFLHNLHGHSSMKIRITPTFKVSIFFLVIIYLPYLSRVTAVLQQIFPSLISKTFSIIY